MRNTWIVTVPRDFPPRDLKGIDALLLTCEEHDAASHEQLYGAALLGHVSFAVDEAVDAGVSADVSRSSTARPPEVWGLADGVGGVADGGERLLPGEPVAVGRLFAWLSVHSGSAGPDLGRVAIGCNRHSSVLTSQNVLSCGSPAHAYSAGPADPPRLGTERSVVRSMRAVVGPVSPPRPPAVSAGVQPAHPAVRVIGMAGDRHEPDRSRRGRGRHADQRAHPHRHHQHR
ncbi:hypothetical protein [Amycolatopsis vancoresmycina]|uniref:hypothetical protein n=1 Tax=Amycolatopsis vancoresmycina TaxID=208444 RepID=UPI0012DE2192|nr:hypothetical protein [Amycolatopsis vancoresmycina]